MVEAMKSYFTPGGSFGELENEQEAEKGCSYCTGILNGNQSSISSQFRDPLIFCCADCKHEFINSMVLRGTLPGYQAERYSLL